MSRTGQINVARLRELERVDCLPEDPLANVFAVVKAAKQAAKLARIQARKAAKLSPKNSGADLPLAEEPACTVCSAASDWLVARMIIEGKLVPANLNEINRPAWEKLFTISQ